jgi:hypothetical protein
LIAGAFTMATLILGAITRGHLFHNADIEDLKKKQEIVDYDLKNRVDVERKLSEFDYRLKDLERVNATLEQKKRQAMGKSTAGKQP